MTIDIKSVNGHAVAILNGEIDHHNAQEIRTQLDKYIMTVQPSELTMDFGNITFMDSSGIGLIMGRSRLMRECGGNLEIRNPQPYIRRVMKLAGMERLVKIT